jgi:hypothetical protein
MARMARGAHRRRNKGSRRRLRGLGMFRVRMELGFFVGGKAIWFCGELSWLVCGVWACSKRV